MTVSTILSSKGNAVFSLAPDTTVQDATRFLAEKRIGAAIILDAGGKLAGILSERDLVRTIAKQGADALSRPVSEAMTGKVITCSPADTIPHVMGLMTAGRFRHLPVLENGALAGMISIGDVVKARIADAEAESQSLRDYIQLAS
jgi:CBS domain-containing protein